MDTGTCHQRRASEDGRGSGVKKRGGPGGVAERPRPWRDRRGRRVGRGGRRRPLGRRGLESGRRRLPGSESQRRKRARDSTENNNNKKEERKGREEKGLNIHSSHMSVINTCPKELSLEHTAH